MEPTQIILAGFGAGVSAKQLTEYLEKNVGIVWRCRLKTLWTPPSSFPKFTGSSNGLVENREKAPPHAFVHFAAPDAVKEAVRLSSLRKLVFNNQALKIKVGNETSSRVLRRRTTPPHRFSPVTVEIGSLYSLDEFWVAWRGPTSGVDFHVDPFDKRCKIIFTRRQLFSSQKSKKDTFIKCDFKIEFLIKDIRNVRFIIEMGTLAMLIQLWVPPFIYYRTADDDIHVAVPFALLDDDDPWIRTLDFTPNNAIGRCLVYKIAHSPRLGHTMEKAKEYFKQNRLLDENISNVSNLKSRREPTVPRPEFFLVLPPRPQIHFDTMFLLTALVHKAIVNYHRLNPEFYSLLNSEVPSTKMSTMALRYMLCETYPVLDPLGKLKNLLKWIEQNPKLLKSPKIVEETIEVRRLIITPTKACCLPPEIELSNRVIRQFKRYADRFLRVTFMDDSMEAMSSMALTVPISPLVKDIAKDVSSSYLDHRTAIYLRVKQILLNGFELCGRRYSFLAFSANQLRDRSAWFFANDKSIDVHQIKCWMGTFPENNVAKHAARMGQCFSSTYCTVQVPRNQLEEDFHDIERNDYKFSDGIGKITPDLAMEVAQKLKLTIKPPSAYQIRYGGFKGVVATWEAEPGSTYKLSLRPSMKKFESQHDILEIITWTRFQPCFLNRQIITLLSALRVPDSTFSELQDSMVHKLSQMTGNVEMAFDILTTSCMGDLQYTAAVMMSAGFKPQTEPHLKDMLSSIRSVQLEELLRKSKIFVPDGRWLMGCLDEIGELEYGQCFIKISSPPLEGCILNNDPAFVERKMGPRVIKGKVIVAKNPCLHPGDVRILEAVDAPGLHHLVDCLVFPQKGHRPHPDEASGSDLDGDIYFVSWDSRLMPESGESWEPMCYAPAQTKESKAPVTREDVIEFFVQHMVNDSLGVICNAHVVRADLSDCGALDEDCLKLAKLAAEAVDFPKTGKVAVMPHNLRPKQYPDFMDKEDSVSYRSEKILGKLYREVMDMLGEEVDEQKCCIEKVNTFDTLPYDSDLEVDGFQEYVQEAWEYKCSYDRQFQTLLGQFSVRKEGEIVTGHISSLTKYNSRRQGEIKKRLQHAYRALRKEFRLIFEGTRNFQNLEPCERSKYEAKASAWYHVTYHTTWVQKTMEHLTEPDSCPSVPLLSFAWITVDFLAQIKLRKRWPSVDYSPAIRSILPPFMLVSHK
ncbi:probable RNA-dependent RNA polymerase SHL2 [Cryptomeria japonica]|uniref:probable RNA-dependent RNA polymerase SHL2 n=1 Tax=Cryptomeria japonica TaxID=3369 RepID=UPI0025AD7B81|nr:probable RNA-dependent RNA polymerase SHL2 [Cryptomeria japonica]XP_057866433.1 probable RNA-dependent RNA polymerase SHL2 [Cryptomeria japonica]XP_059066952.1 probable RNA-dependent RNA polymerase SHL2 [Cryptomeria japonica]